MCYTIIRKRKENKKRRTKKMTRQEIEKKIEDIKNREFYLQMKDRWDWKDYEISRKHREEIRELEKELEKA